MVAKNTWDNEDCSLFSATLKGTKVPNLHKYTTHGWWCAFWAILSLIQSQTLFLWHNGAKRNKRSYIQNDCITDCVKRILKKDRTNNTWSGSAELIEKITPGCSRMFSQSQKWIIWSFKWRLWMSNLFLETDFISQSCYLWNLASIYFICQEANTSVNLLLNKTPK